MTAEKVDMDALVALRRLEPDRNASKSQSHRALVMFSVREYRKDSPFLKGNNQQVADWNPIMVATRSM